MKNIPRENEFVYVKDLHDTLKVDAVGWGFADDGSNYADVHLEDKKKANWAGV